MKSGGLPDAENAQALEGGGRLKAIPRNEVVRWRMNFSSAAIAEFEGLLEVNRKFGKQQGVFSELKIPKKQFHL